MGLDHTIKKEWLTLETPNFLVSRMPHERLQKIFNATVWKDQPALLGPAFPDVEYKVYSDKKMPYRQREVGIEFDISCDDNCELIYKIRRINTGNSVLTVHSDDTDLANWSEKRRENLKQKVEEKQSKAMEQIGRLDTYLNAYHPQNSESNYVNRDNQLDELDEEFQILIEQLCEAPWSPFMLDRVRQYANKRAEYHTGTREQTDKTVDTLRKAFSEYMQTKEFKQVDPVEQKTIIQFIETDIDKIKEEAYNITFACNRKQAILEIKNNIYLNGIGDQVNWSDI
ncbi:hypothetical protein GF343_05215 [Candidatus Woesearchaeota archaeon]|nr:hypothetical protein [Candidatus Woesearchaeota archaeon]